MERQKKHQRRLLLFICIALFVFANVLFSTTLQFTLGAEKTTYTTVIEDLSADSTFKLTDYPEDYTDYSVNVIQVAESTDKELFIYVYIPTPGIEVTTLNMATSKDVTSVKNYKLKLLSKSTTLYKYVVTNFTLRPTDTRYYNIVSIFRLPNRLIDKDPDNGNTINEVAHEVAQLWTFTGSGASTEVTRVDTETITITDKYVGFVRYPQSGALSTGAVYAFGNIDPGFDSHFVAFNTDKTIDKLLEADVYYTSQSYSYYNKTTGVITPVDEETFGNETGTTVHLTYNDVGGGTIGKYRKYEWYRIQTMEEFMLSEDNEYIYNCGVFNIKEQDKLTAEGRKDLQGKNWVLRFVETDYKYTKDFVAGYTTTRQNWTIVGNVTILRLKFDCNGQIYNLGVVDGKHTGDGIPDNEHTVSIEPNTSLFSGIKKVFKIIAYCLLGVLAFIILAPILPYIIKAILLVIKYVLLVVWWVITLPFKLFRRNK